VSISFDGADAETHDKFRGLPGSFDQSLAGMRNLRAAGVATQVNCTIARHDKDQIEDVLQLAEREGAVALHYFLLVPVGCGEEIAEDQMLDQHEVEDRLKLIDDLVQKTSLQIKPTCAPQYYRVIRQQAKEQGRPMPGTSKAGHPGGPPGGHPGGQPAGGSGYPGGHPGGHPSLHSITKGCLAGTSVCFISHEGDVFPCGYLPTPAGNVRRQQFQEIWRDSEIFAQLRNPNLLTGKCGACEYKMVCSGCRARAYYEFGSILAEEPFCSYQPNSGKSKAGT
jgi:radical SAM protein with 4Fe4S-binding SPASM domain